MASDNHGMWTDRWTKRSWLTALRSERHHSGNVLPSKCLVAGRGFPFPGSYNRSKHIIRKLLTLESHFCSFWFQQRSGSWVRAGHCLSDWIKTSARLIRVWRPCWQRQRKFKRWTGPAQPNIMRCTGDCRIKPRMQQRVVWTRFSRLRRTIVLVTMAGSMGQIDTLWLEYWRREKEGEEEGVGTVAKCVAVVDTLLRRYTTVSWWDRKVNRTVSSGIGLCVWLAQLVSGGRLVEINTSLESAWFLILISVGFDLNRGQLGELDQVIVCLILCRNWFL